MPGIYLHIPYCRTCCPYCDFVSEAVPGCVPEAYVEALCREIRSFRSGGIAATVFFGGGTPSLCDPAGLERVLGTLHRRFTVPAQAEISLEANPDDITRERVREWRRLGINRLSIGVQSFDDEVLRYLGRRHDAAAARRACVLAAELFENWSMDLIFGGRPAEAWTATLHEAQSFSPKHLSAYGLTYEEGTPFADRKHEALEDDDALECYQEAERLLADYTHYEISNYALPGYECQHNLTYWHNEEYVGFGAGAYSYIEGVRACNHSDTRHYLAAPGAKEEAQTLPDHEIRLETLLQHLRLRDGLPRAYYRKRFGAEVELDFGPSLRSLQVRGLVQMTAEAVLPTAEGFYLNNEIGLALVE